MKKSVERHDIINNLKYGSYVEIAKVCHTSSDYVNHILLGDTGQKSKLAKKVIDIAQIYAAVNIWNNRFCQSKPTISNENLHELLNNIIRFQS